MGEKQKSIGCKAGVLQSRADNFNKRACKKINEGANDSDGDRNRKQDDKAGEKVFFHSLFVPQIQGRCKGKLLLFVFQAWFNLL